MISKKEALDEAGIRCSELIEYVNKTYTPEEAIMALEAEMMVHRNVSDILAQMIKVEGTRH